MCDCADTQRDKEDTPDTPEAALMSFVLNMDAIGVPRQVFMHPTQILSFGLLVLGFVCSRRLY